MRQNKRKSFRGQKQKREKFGKIERGTSAEKTGGTKKKKQSFVRLGAK